MRYKHRNYDWHMEMARILGTTEEILQETGAHAAQHVNLQDQRNLCKARSALSKAKSYFDDLFFKDLHRGDRQPESPYYGGRWK